MTSIEKAVNIIKQNLDLSHFHGRIDNNVIKQVEERLNTRFPDSYHYFLQELGVGNFGDKEFYGIINGHLDHPSLPNMIWLNENRFKNDLLPKGFLVIYIYGDGSPVCINTKIVDEYGESPVGILNIPNKENTFEKIADSFGDFFLSMLLRVLKQEGRPE